MITDLETYKKNGQSDQYSNYNEEPVRGMTCTHDRRKHEPQNDRESQRIPVHASLLNLSCALEELLLEFFQHRHETVPTGPASVKRRTP